MIRDGTWVEFVHLGYFAFATANDSPSSSPWLAWPGVVWWAYSRHNWAHICQAPPTVSIESSRGRSLREVEVTLL